MAHEINIADRKFWVVSEPIGTGWRAQVLEVVGAQGVTRETGIETTGESRGVADGRAIRQLERLFNEQASAR